MDEPSKLEGHHDLSVIDFRSKAVPAKAKKTINSFLIPPLPPNKIPTKNGKSAGTIMTSRQNLLMIQERERKKQEETLQKEERKRLREEKAALKKLEARRKEEKKKVLRLTTNKGRSRYGKFYCFSYTYSKGPCLVLIKFSSWVGTNQIKLLYYKRSGFTFHLMCECTPIIWIQVE